MRLIDADRLKKHYAHWGHFDEQNQEIKRIFDDIIDVQPTIESRPTGTWETHKRAVLYKGAKEYVAEIYHECSNCKQEAEIVENGCWLHSKYCPNCGARMEEEE